MKCLAGCLAGINYSMMLSSNIDRRTIKSTLHKDLSYNKEQIVTEIYEIFGSFVTISLRNWKWSAFEWTFDKLETKTYDRIDSIWMQSHSEAHFFVSSKLKLASLIPDKWRRKISGCVIGNIKQTGSSESCERIMFSTPD